MSAEVISALIGALATVGAAAMGIRRKMKSGSSKEDEPALSSSREAIMKKQHKYDVFISSPMAAFTNNEALAADRARIQPLLHLMENQLGLSVYWAGRDIEKMEDFGAADLSAKSDLEAIRESRFFLLLYPERMVSSVLFEAGVALRACLTSIYFVRDRTDLPFLMTQGPQAFSNVRIYEGVLPDDLMNLLERHGVTFFDQVKRAELEEAA